MDMEKLKCATDFIDSYLADIVINEELSTHDNLNTTNEIILEFQMFT